MVEWNAGMEKEWNAGIVIYYPAYNDEIKLCIRIPSLMLPLELCTKDYNNQLAAGT